MATNTYVELDKKTTTTSVASVEFTGVSAAYTDLVLVMEYSLSAANDSVFMRFNSDSTTNYSDTVMTGNGSTAASYRDTSSSNGIRISATNSAQGSGTRQTSIVQIMNYANTTTYKTVLDRYSSVGGTEVYAGLWRKTPEAINTITLRFAGSANFETGSTFSLYGIAAANPIDTTDKAIGGTVYSDASYYYHVFTASSNFTPKQSLSCDILALAGGGGGGNAHGGGGGAGGILAFASQSLTATNYAVTVGSGGAGRQKGLAGENGFSGTNTQFSSLTASVGGGGGGARSSFSPSASLSGGSGGGGGGAQSAGSGASGTGGQGNSGGNGTSNGTAGNGGGGGGAGANGGSASGAGDGVGSGGNGGVGINTITNWGTFSAVISATNLGSSGYMAAGGGGGCWGGATAGTGGTGGGGNGGRSAGLGVDGVIYTGSGGGGAADFSPGGGNGGSGVVIVRYAK